MPSMRMEDIPVRIIPYLSVYPFCFHKLFLSFFPRKRHPGMTQCLLPGL